MDHLDPAVQGRLHLGQVVVLLDTVGTGTTVTLPMGPLDRHGHRNKGTDDTEEKNDAGDEKSEHLGGPEHEQDQTVAQAGADPTPEPEFAREVLALGTPLPPQLLLVPVRSSRRRSHALRRRARVSGVRRAPWTEAAYPVRAPSSTGLPENTPAIRAACVGLGKASRPLAVNTTTEPTTAQRAHQAEITLDTTVFGHSPAFPAVSVGFSCRRSSVLVPDPIGYGPPQISTAVPDCSGSAVR